MLTLTCFHDKCSRYADIQADLDQFKGRPLVIALVPDLPPYGDRKLGEFLRESPADPLHSAGYDVLLMGLIDLELDVHRAQTTGLTLQDVLEIRLRDMQLELGTRTEFVPDDLPKADGTVKLFCQTFEEIFSVCD